MPFDLLRNWLTFCNQEQKIHNAFKKLKKRSHRSHEILQYLKALTFAEPLGEARGVTWMELLILFEANHGHEWPTEGEKKIRQSNLSYIIAEKLRKRYERKLRKTIKKFVRNRNKIYRF